MNLNIAGGRVLLSDGGIEETNLRIADGRIAEIGGGAGRGAWDARGLLVLPGLVDYHGDAFERQIMPRPGVSFPLDLALLDTDAQLIAAGITTACHGITCSWEPGLRSVGTMRGLMEALDRLRPRLAADHRIHLRFETYNLDAVDEVCEGLAAGRFDLLAFNDHTPEIARRAERPEAAAKYAERSGLDTAGFRALVAAVSERRQEVAPALERLAAAARQAGVPMLAHDEDTPELRRHYRALGATLSEFPKNFETAREAREAGESVVMGAPNVVRGGSHLGAAGAADFVKAGLCDVLASDYHYPSLLYAPFRLAAAGVLDFGAAWRLVAANPARAAGLSDRGEIAVGKRADLLLVDDGDPGLPRLAAVLVAGRPVAGGARVPA